ncbi:RagB/SusD family nutrient uptake outer membrane protein [Pedobacter psychrodurus]|uniref:RagB/SusD family nutrient uptake outer membrane protein n=1 Tax=Pedobacter psychrodurus TaxID=2530456 RepID=UPI00293058E2|nr:RagB/SusD family nutrient uptake outer membrane protein [Pedobacter psychrodurus]
MKNFKLIIQLVSLVWLSSCEKFLDEKPVKSYATPSKVVNLQAILDYYPSMNTSDISGGEISASDYYLSDAQWAALATENFRNMYVWSAKDVYPLGSNDWSNAYKSVYIANTAIDGLNKIKADQSGFEWNNVMGQALAFRAKFFLQIASVWSMSFDSNSAAADLGIPLRLNSDFNELSVRSSLQQTYDQILKDLKAAVLLLPVSQVSPLRPSRPAAYGLLARTYLSMRDYVSAGKYADSCLQLSNQILDFNTLNPSAAYPVPKLNTEVIFESYMTTAGPINPTRSFIDLDLYNSYAADDLRKVVFYKDNNNGTYAFKGSYEGSAVLFSGLATNEIYLTRAECAARAGRLQDAMNDVNTLLSKRWNKSKPYVPYTASSIKEALDIVLKERRKELVMRGLRWIDIKRLNREGAGIVQSRQLNGITYTLPPNDPRYALAIPEDIITLSGIQQNPR